MGIMKRSASFPHWYHTIASVKTIYLQHLLAFTEYFPCRTKPQCQCNSPNLSGFSPFNKVTILVNFYLSHNWRANFSKPVTKGIHWSSIYLLWQHVFDWRISMAWCHVSKVKMSSHELIADFHLKFQGSGRAKAKSEPSSSDKECGNAFTSPQHLLIYYHWLLRKTPVGTEVLTMSFSPHTTEQEPSGLFTECISFASVSVNALDLVCVSFPTLFFSLFLCHHEKHIFYISSHFPHHNFGNFINFMQQKTTTNPKLHKGSLLYFLNGQCWKYRSNVPFTYSQNCNELGIGIKYEIWPLL